MTIPTDPTKPITAEAQDLGIAIDTLKKRLDAIDSSKRIEYENLLDILIQRRRALTERLDAMPNTDPGIRRGSGGSAIPCSAVACGPLPVWKRTRNNCRLPAKRVGA